MKAYFFSLLCYRVFSVFSLILACMLSGTLLAKEVLYIGADSYIHVNKLYLPFYQQFEQQTGIKIVRVKLEDIKLLDNDKAWYTPSGKPIDVINGQVSQRLLGYYQSGKIEPLNDFWHKHQLNKDFSHVEEAITYNGKILALPYNIHTWQIYHLKSTFTEEFPAPTTIDELANVCKKLSLKGVVPFHITDQSPWMHMAWFEYLILRTHGLNFYDQLTTGKIKYTSDAVKEVMLVWQSLINSNCFSDQYGSMNWHQIAPFLFRKKVAMTFSGIGFTTRLASPQHKNDIDFFIFPKGKQRARFESAPMSAFHMSGLTSKKEAVHKFLLFMANAKVQSTLNQALSILPANINSPIKSNPLEKKIARIISTSDGTSTFFDRKVKPEFEVASRPHFINVVKTGNIVAFMHSMEELRLAYY